MERNDIAYLINSVAKYYYLLDLHIGLLHRYAYEIKWPIYFATEEPENPICRMLKEKYNIHILVLEKENSSFLSSRKRALELLPSDIKYVFPMQEDFLLERYIDRKSIEESIDILEKDDKVFCIRYMPCPGPHKDNLNYNCKWRHITKKDTYRFCFQASLWKREECYIWYNAICNEVMKRGIISKEKQKELEVNMNIAENSVGQELFSSLFNNKTIIGYIRHHKEPNAVYMSPWPYRPTAVIKGVLQPFAIELAIREGYHISI
uniref:Glycosyltransferase n=1 Tax=viral metagenome TaxID=1070528 RepID=A0A6C0IEC8_9ZZZZ